MTMRILALLVICLCFGKALPLAADANYMTEACNQTEVSTVWFKLISEPVRLTVVATDPADIQITPQGRVGNVVQRSIAFEDGTEMALPDGSLLFFDAAPFSCDAQIAFAKSEIVADLATGARLSDLPDAFVSVALGQSDCTMTADKNLCAAMSEGLFEIGGIPPELADRLISDNAPVIRVSTSWASTITFVFDVQTRTLLELYSEHI